MDIKLLSTIINKSNPYRVGKGISKTKSGTGSILVTTAERAAPEPGKGSIIYKMKESGLDSIFVKDFHKYLHSV